MKKTLIKQMMKVMQKIAKENNAKGWSHVTIEGFINSEKNVIENLNIYVNGFKSNLKVKKSKQKTAY